ncbi:forkhead box protein C2-B-like [Liolophura sinensis]|uniref:forkhead box protein C2-B-like n=1 Tax=Liolophura sinensis TaxID=3198878 RepID=UPI0031598AF8
MFGIESSPAALSYPSAYSSSRLRVLTGAPFLATSERFGLPQPVRTLGQLPSTYPEPYRYQTVSTSQPWGTTPSPLTAPYRYNSGSPYHKLPYVYHQNGIGLVQSFPQASFCDIPQEPKPTQSYIGLIAIAILSTKEKKLVLSDIYKYILDHYPYFRSRGPGWRNSIRHNLSLNECFIKSDRSSNGKGHFWAVHPANVEDFSKGDFRRRRAQRKVRKYMSQKRSQSHSESLQKDDGLTLVEVTNDTEKLEDDCDTDIPCDWPDNDSEIDVLDTEDVVDEVKKPVHRRGAFDMDTILSTYFPCARNTVLNAASDNDEFPSKSHEEVPLMHIHDGCRTISG